MVRFLLWAVMTAAAIPAAAIARVLQVGDAKEFKVPSGAVREAHDGDTIAIYPGQYVDCAVVTGNKLVIEGIGKADAVVMTDKSCQGKAILVTTGQGITIRNMTLTRSRVPDGNGAGIRQEGRDLTVDGVRFVNNQNGILSGVRGGFIVVRNSQFERNGACDRACAHGLYVGPVDLLRVERSRFYETKRGHHIKSRALRTEITDCTIEDGPDGTASYEVDISNGGTLIARNNTIVKGPNAENHSAAIIIGAEGIEQLTKEITIEKNTFRNEGPWQAIFVNNMTATDAELRGNAISGKVQPLKGDGHVFAEE